MWADPSSAPTSRARTSRTIAWATTFTFTGSGGACVLVLELPHAAPVSAMPVGRVRGHTKRQDEEKVTLDYADPWTSEEILQARIAAPTRRTLDNADPWSGKPIVVTDSVLVRIDTLDPYSAD